ncbi:hypothetical protein F4815DRAFT_450308 [Daldinia loculata]|nr:hypothetical protein F4815DRAFT_450308 [Daldinia loculata]
MTWANIYRPIRPSMTYGDGCLYTPLAKIIGVNAVSDDPMKLHSFTSSELILKGIAVLAYASAIGPLVPAPDVNKSFKYNLRLTNRLITERYLIPVHIEVFVTWDEDVSIMAADPDEWLILHEERKQELLFMFLTYTHDLEIFSPIRGLVLRRFYCPTNQDLFVRIGWFSAGNRNLFKRCIAKRVVSPVTKDNVKNGIVDDPFRAETIDLENPELADLVHTVTII